MFIHSGSHEGGTFFLEGEVVTDYFKCCLTKTETLQKPPAAGYTDLAFWLTTEKVTNWLAFLWLQSSRMEQSPLNWILMRKHHQLLRRISDH